MNMSIEGDLNSTVTTKDIYKGMYIYLYAILVVSSLLSGGFQECAYAFGVCLTAKRLYEKMFSHLLRCPTVFFDRNSSGK